MFLDSYLDEYHYDELLDMYEYNYLISIDKDNFKKVYDILEKYNFNYIEDIIVKYIELFTINPNYIEQSIITFINKLGTNYVNIMGNDMRYFDMIIDSYNK